MQIFVGSTSLDIPDLYPDDLPDEWRFDYYYNNFNALKLSCDTNYDFDDILDEIDEEFKLVVDITNNFNLDLFLQKTKNYSDNIIFYSNNTDNLAQIKDFNFCLTTKIDKVKANNLKIMDNDLYYNNYPIITIPKPKDEKHIREIIENLLPIKSDIVLLIDNADSEILEKTKIIIDLLN